MTDRERTLVAGIVAVASAALAVAGLIVSRYVNVVGWALLTLGAAGMLDAILIGLGVRTFGAHRKDEPPDSLGKH